MGEDLDGKICTKCHQWLPVAFFSRDRATYTELKSWCKTCVRVYRQSKKD